MGASPQDVQALLDAAVAALELTTVGYKNKNWKTPPPGSNWAVALADIAAARAEAGMLAAPVTPPPSPTSGPWAWDAGAASLDPNSAALIAAWESYGNLGSAYLSACVATADTDAASPGYAVPCSGGGKTDAAVYIPAGTKPGTSSDHHLTVWDAIHGRETDMWEAVYDATTGRIGSCTNGASFPLGAAQEPAQGAGAYADAAMFPLRRGLVTPGDVAAGVIDHPLVFSMPNVGPAPNRYPANSTEGYPTHTGFPLGTWVRLDPAYVVSGLPKLETLICRALQRYGMFCRDIGSNFDIYGADPGGGGNSAAWAAVGVTVSQPAGAYRFQPLPWPHMQVLQPPPK